MYRIDVLTGQDAVISERLSRICAEQGLFPRIEQYPDQEHFFTAVQETVPTNAVIALPGV